MSTHSLRWMYKKYRHLTIRWHVKIKNSSICIAKNDGDTITERFTQCIQQMTLKYFGKGGDNKDKPEYWVHKLLNEWCSNDRETTFKRQEIQCYNRDRENWKSMDMFKELVKIQTRK